MSRTCLINGSNGIAVGMATNIPPHNLREVAEAIYWALENFEADEESTLAAVHGARQGTGLPDARPHRRWPGHPRCLHHRPRLRSACAASSRSRKTPTGRTTIVITELPYQVNPDNLITSIAEQVSDGKIGGISDIHDESSDRVGMRIVVTVKRDAVAKVVLNNLYKHTQLQTSFGCNMLSIVDGVPRTLRLDQMIRLYVDASVRGHRSAYPVPAAQGRGARPHPARPGQGARRAGRGHRPDPASQTVDTARAGLMDLLDIDEIQADAILDMQLRRLAALERQKIVDELAEIEPEIADLKDILAKPGASARDRS